jgi:hypothetical protein
VSATDGKKTLRLDVTVGRIPIYDKGRKRVEYAASLGELRAQAASEPEAIEGLAGLVRAMADAGGATPSVLFDFDGHVWIAYPMGGSWVYSHYRPATTAVRYGVVLITDYAPPGSARAGGAACGFATRAECVEAMQRHWYANNAGLIVRGLLGLFTREREFVCSRCQYVNRSEPPYVCKAPGCGALCYSDDEERFTDDEGCAGCLTASPEFPCLGHGCTKWCKRHAVRWFATDVRGKHNALIAAMYAHEEAPTAATAASLRDAIYAWEAAGGHKHGTRTVPVNTPCIVDGCLDVRARELLGEPAQPFGDHIYAEIISEEIARQPLTHITDGAAGDESTLTFLSGEACAAIKRAGLPKLSDGAIAAHVLREVKAQAAQLPGSVQS